MEKCYNKKGQVALVTWPFKPKNVIRNVTRGR
jgi:hypothetical protein